MTKRYLSIMGIALMVFANRECLANGENMLEAAATGDNAQIIALKEIGVSTDVTNRWGQTPLHLAAASGHTETTKLLCSYDPTTRADNSCNNSIHTALGHPEPLKVILDWLSSSDRLKAHLEHYNNAALYPLSAAAGAFCLQSVELLIAAKADINQTGPYPCSWETDLISSRYERMTVLDHALKVQKRSDTTAEQQKINRTIIAALQKAGAKEGW